MCRRHKATLTGLEAVTVTFVGATLLRAVVSKPQVDASLLAAMLTLTTCAAACLATLLLAPRWHAQHGCAMAVLLRLAVVGLSALPGVAVTAWLRQDEIASCTLFLWRWLLSSVAAPALLTCLAWSLPSRAAALAVVALHQVLLAHSAAARCGVQLTALSAGAASHATLLQLDPDSCLDAAVPGLDWPLYFVAPESMLRWGGLSHRAACLALTLWAQSALGALLPGMLLLGLDARRRAAVALAQEFDASCPAQAAQERGGGWAAAARTGLVQCVADMPLSSALFALQMHWMLLRTACTHVSQS